MHEWPKKAWWSGRIDDPSDGLAMRWHQKIILATDTLGHEVTLSKNQIVSLLGYASDLGTRLNQGRPGSADGPEMIRKELGNLAWHGDRQIIDQGNIYTLESSVESLQKELSQKIHDLQKKGHFSIVLGGSHDLTFGHFMGTFRHLKQRDPEVKFGVINVDAHFDLRAYKNGAHSGSPFLQISDLLKQENKSLSYLCLGVQKFANTADLYRTADKLGVQWIDGRFFNVLNFLQVKNAVENFLMSQDYVHISIDMDGFSAATAPGVSAPAHSGFDPVLVETLLALCARTNKVTGLDLAETNPKFDIDNRTARLAASLIHLCIQSLP